MKRSIVFISLWFLLGVYFFQGLVLLYADSTSARPSVFYSSRQSVFSMGKKIAQAVGEREKKETVLANPVWYSHTHIKVGEYFKIRYVLSPTYQIGQENIYKEDISYDTNDTLIISHIKTQIIPNNDESYNSDIILEIEMIAKHTGIHLIPPITIFDTITVTFPHIYVYSILDTNHLSLIPMDQYIPIKEIAVLVGLLLGITISIYLFIRLIRNSSKKIREIRYKTNDIIHMYTSYRKVGIIKKRLVKVSNKRQQKKFPLSYACYLSLLTIIRIRIQFMYGNTDVNSGTHPNTDAKTPEEIEKIFMARIYIEKEVQEGMMELFATFDAVLYGNKKIPIKTRIYHCNICQQLLVASLHTRKEDDYNAYKTGIRSIHR